ncbi:hypothetical protein P4114_26175 [Pseudomonas aeruginosa]|nr:hypothetical protein [Pseudomonas aeruginosa]
MGFIVTGNGGNGERPVILGCAIIIYLVVVNSHAPDFEVITVIGGLEQEFWQFDLKHAIGVDFASA